MPSRKGQDECKGLNIIFTGLLSHRGLLSIRAVGLSCFLIEVIGALICFSACRRLLVHPFRQASSRRGYIRWRTDICMSMVLANQDIMPTSHEFVNRPDINLPCRRSSSHSAPIQRPIHWQVLVSRNLLPLSWVFRVHAVVLLPRKHWSHKTFQSSRNRSKRVPLTKADSGLVWAYWLSRRYCIAYTRSIKPLPML